jgi:hypothetical protein
MPTNQRGLQQALQVNASASALGIDPNVPRLCEMLALMHETPPPHPSAPARWLRAALATRNRRSSR